MIFYGGYTRLRGKILAEVIRMVKKMVLVSGMSGAGKSTAMSILEDLGYHCIDQFPVELMPELVNLLRTTDNSRYDEVAISTSLSDFSRIHDALENAGIPLRNLVLKAQDDQLVTRYKFTRHTHPMIVEGEEGSLDKAIRKERKILEALPQYRNTIYLDTGDLTYQDLKRQMDNTFSLTVNHDLSITFESFGYKYGIPKDADFLFDARVLPNPYWVPELRHYTGDDPGVYAYVMDAEVTKEYMKRLTGFLDYIFETYENRGRSHIMIAIGCTGGKHRSLSVVNYLMNYYGKRYLCYKAAHHPDPEAKQL